jgi:hypothetical protein
MTDRSICNACGLRFTEEPVGEDTCPECGGPLRRMALLEAWVDRWLAPPPQVSSDMHHRHLQLIELLWTANDRGREFYELANLDGVSYSRFVRRVTDVVCQGLAEGWIEAEIPLAPIPDDRHYKIHYHEPQRFADAVIAAFKPRRAPRPADERTNGHALDDPPRIG